MCILVGHNGIFLHFSQHCPPALAQLVQSETRDFLPNLNFSNFLFNGKYKVTVV